MPVISFSQYNVYFQLFIILFPQCSGSSPTVSHQRLFLNQNFILIHEETQVVIIDSAEMEVQAVLWGLDKKYRLNAKDALHQCNSLELPLYENMNCVLLNMARNQLTSLYRAFLLILEKVWLSFKRLHGSSFCAMCVGFIKGSFCT